MAQNDPYPWLRPSCPISQRSRNQRKQELLALDSQTLNLNKRHSSNQSSEFQKQSHLKNELWYMHDERRFRNSQNVVNGNQPQGQTERRFGTSGREDRVVIKQEGQSLYGDCDVDITSYVSYESYAEGRKTPDWLRGSERFQGDRKGEGTVQRRREAIQGGVTGRMKEEIALGYYLETYRQDERLNAVMEDPRF